MQRAFPLPPNSPSEHLSYEYWRIRWNKLTARDQTYYRKKRTAKKKTAFPSIGDGQAAIILTKHQRLNRTGRMGFWSFHYFFTKIMIFVFPPPKGWIISSKFYVFIPFPFFLFISREEPSSSAPRSPSPPLTEESQNSNRGTKLVYTVRMTWQKKHRDIKCRPIWQIPPVQNKK